MPDPLAPLHTVSSVKNRIVALENVTASNGDRAKKGSQSHEDPPLLEIAQNLRTHSAQNSTDSATRSKSSGTQNSSYRRGHKKIDSTAFLQQSYLSDSSPADLTEDAREILKSQPDPEDLLAVLQYLQCGIDRKHDFNIRAPSAKASQITNVLVSITILDHWPCLRSKKLSDGDKQLKGILVSCLASVTGIGALLAQIKKSSAPSAGRAAENFTLRDTISVLESILGHTAALYDFIKSTLAATEKPTQRLVIWQELVSLLAGSKILTVVSHASRSHKIDDDLNELGGWLGDGPKYCTWLAKSIAHAATILLVKDVEAWSMLAQITRRGFSLGNRDAFVADLYNSLLFGHKAAWAALHELLRALPRWEQKAFFDGMMRDVARNQMESNITSLSVNSSPVVRDQTVEAVAALVAGVTENNKFLQEYIVEWLVDDNGTNASAGLRARRAVMATLANHEEKLQEIIDKCLESLSDKLQIQHTPMLQQEATVQTLLLAVSYSNRLNHDFVKAAARSSSYLNTVSNRLGSSIERARYLGMIIGVALSRIVDEPEKAMNFGAEEMESEESKNWLELINTQDFIGDHELLQNTKTKKGRIPTMPAPHSESKPRISASKSVTTSKIISIEEIEDSEPEDDDLIPYQKPDDDHSDSEEDPTLIDRSKPAAPIYIIDLIKSLNMNEKLDVVELALKTAPTLIRRKVGFGTELSDNIEKLASSLFNLNEGMSKPQPQKLRLQALIACLVAVPGHMGPWLGSMYFEGDFSLVQRATLLTTIGLGCRELAGYTDDASLALPQEKFPSKRLPEKFSAIYTPVGKITSELSRSTLEPMALAAADKLSGPDVLKVRTFSSRLEVQKRAAQKSKERSIRIPKELHKIITDFFYLPLCCRMSLLLSSRPQISRSTIFEPHTFKLFLQILTILINTLGPHASQLSTITRETLILLIQLHTTLALSLDPAVLPSMLLLLLSIVDLNIEAGAVAEERLVTEFGQTITELMAWIDGLKDLKIPIQEGEGMPWTAIVAGCQVKWQEVGRKFQGRMVGLMGADMENFS